jgi:hypothetical protein
VTDPTIQSFKTLQVIKLGQPSGPKPNSGEQFTLSIQWTMSKDNRELLPKFINDVWLPTELISKTVRAKYIDKDGNLQWVPIESHNFFA